MEPDKFRDLRGIPTTEWKWHETLRALTDSQLDEYAKVEDRKCAKFLIERERKLRIAKKRFPSDPEVP